MPLASSKDLILDGIEDILNALHHPSAASPLAPLTDSHTTALHQLTTILTGLSTSTPTPIPTPVPPPSALQLRCPTSEGGAYPAASSEGGHPHPKSSAQLHHAASKGALCHPSPHSQATAATVCGRTQRR
jgi:hypothetical protein